MTIEAVILAIGLLIVASCLYNSVKELIEGI